MDSKSANVQFHISDTKRRKDIYMLRKTTYGTAPNDMEAYIPGVQNDQNIWQPRWKEREREELEGKSAVQGFVLWASYTTSTEFGSQNCYIQAMVESEEIIQKVFANDVPFDPDQDIVFFKSGEEMQNFHDIWNASAEIGKASEENAADGYNINFIARNLRYVVVEGWFNLRSVPTWEMLSRFRSLELLLLEKIHTERF